MGYGTKSMAGIFCLPNPAKLPADFEDEFNNLVGEFGLDDIEEILDDFIECKWVFLYSALSCLIVAVVYGLLVRYFAKIIVWVSLVGTGAGLIVLSIFMQKWHKDTYVTPVQQEKTLAKVLQWGVYILYGIIGIYFLTVLCLCKSIAVSVAVLKTASVIVMRNTRIMIVPFLASVFIFGYVSGWLVGFGYLMSCAHIEQPTGGS